MTDGQPPPERPGLVRPYLMTGGRTRPTDESLAIESMVRVQPGADAGALRFEAADIVRLCETPVSIAEVAARLTIPLGVARVLVGDLVASGHLTLRSPEEVSTDTNVLERLIERVRAL